MSIRVLTALLLTVSLGVAQEGPAAGGDGAKKPTEDITVMLKAGTPGEKTQLG